MSFLPAPERGNKSARSLPSATPSNPYSASSAPIRLGLVRPGAERPEHLTLEVSAKPEPQSYYGLLMRPHRYEFRTDGLADAARAVGVDLDAPRRDAVADVEIEFASQRLNI